MCGDTAKRLRKNQAEDVGRCVWMGLQNFAEAEV